MQIQDKSLWHSSGTAPHHATQTRRREHCAVLFQWSSLAHCLRTHRGTVGVILARGTSASRATYIRHSTKLRMCVCPICCCNSAQCKLGGWWRQRRHLGAGTRERGPEGSWPNKPGRPQHALLRIVHLNERGFRPQESSTPQVCCA